MTIEEQTGVTFRQVIAGYNHSLAVTSDGRVYTWGYDGSGLLGRKGVQHIPVAIETGWDNNSKGFKVRVPRKVLAIKQDKQDGFKQQLAKVSYSTRVEQVQCVNLGTLVLTDKGDVYYCGDNRYQQLPHSEEHNTNELQKGHEENVFKQINFKFRVKMIACGGDHLFAVTAEDKVFAWGRNDCAQLGIGMQQDYMNAPIEVPAFRDVAVTKIVCGPNYSAAITSSSRLMVAGSIEHGKLGLGPNQRSGFVQNFTLVSRLR